MPDKGKIMSQVHYEKQSRLFNLYRESFERAEMDIKETISALKILGFSETVASIRVNEWKAQHGSREVETEKTKKRRLKEQASLEKYILRNRLGKKYMEFRSKYYKDELSKNETVEELMKFGFDRKYCECTVDKWKRKTKKERK